MPKEIKIDKDLLEELYINQNMMVIEIAETLGYKKDLIRDKLRKYKITKPKKLHVANIKRSCIQKYGVQNGGWTKDSKEKIRKTNLAKYGVEWYKQDKNNQKECEERLKQKYGVINVFQLEEIKEKSKKTNLLKFGCEYNMQNENIRKRVQITKRTNGTFKSSCEEDKIYNMLLTKFACIKRQYSSDVYPFMCDFYIPEIDLYIEHQGYWSHGKHAFNPDDEKDRIRLDSWKAKGTEIYNNAINTWTIRDPLKRKTAEENNLNWVEFFTIEEFNKWFESINKSNS